ncbi:MAG: fused MFS/spermidine synthase, partial [Alphaproteobacteria bacterium]|nr:fused MFS/spermidine synthase [Alphaproteobacteria bacterium]
PMRRVSGLAAQAAAWRLGYGLLIGLTGLCLWQARGGKEAPAKEPTSTPAWRTRGLWILLAFLPSSLLMGATDRIAVDIGSLPLFWIIPLALYLLTFILAFARRQFVPFKTVAALHPLGVALIVFLFLRHPLAPNNGLEYAVIPLAAFFLTALLCHLRLAQARPKAQHLTLFYLCVAFGGSLGGLFNALLVPFLFPLPLEFALMMLAGCLVHPGWRTQAAPSWRILLAASLALLAVAARFAFEASFGTELLLFVSLLVLSRHLKTLVLASVALSLLALFAPSEPRLVDVERNFFGVARIYDWRDGPKCLRGLVNGAEAHTLEQIEPSFALAPAAFFSAEGALENIFRLRPFPNVALVGLGGGAMLCFQNYQGFSHRFTAYEINPAVAALAAKDFSFFRRCGAPEIRLGDARRALAAANERYDLIVIDVFASGTLPVHLLTREAFRLYLDRLAPDGMIAFHVYNRYHDLRQTLSNTIDDLGVQALYKLPRPANNPPLWGTSRWEPSPWIAVARKADLLAPLRARGWEDLPPPRGAVWTDDYSDTLSALK